MISNRMYAGDIVHMGIVFLPRGQQQLPATLLERPIKSWNSVTQAVKNVSLVKSTFIPWHIYPII